MSENTPVSVYWAGEIKHLALRFSKHIQAETGKRIRGRKLYDSFAAILGYSSYSGLVSMAPRYKSARFDYDYYLEQLKRELRKHLPILLSGDEIVHALERAKSPGSLEIHVDGRRSLPDAVQAFMESHFFHCFKAQGLRYSRKHHINFKETLMTSDAGTMKPLPILILLDYRNWSNEYDPVEVWEPLGSFIQQASISADVEICRVTHEDKREILEGVSQDGRFKWDDVSTTPPSLASERVAKIALENAHPTFRLDLTNDLVEPQGTQEGSEVDPISWFQDVTTQANIVFSKLYDTSVTFKGAYSGSPKLSTLDCHLSGKRLVFAFDDVSEPRLIFNGVGDKGSEEGVTMFDPVNEDDFSVEYVLGLMKKYFQLSQE